LRLFFKITEEKDFIGYYRADFRNAKLFC